MIEMNLMVLSIWMARINMLRKKPKYHIDFMKKTTNNDFLFLLIQNIGKIFGYCRNFVHLCPHK